MFIIVGELRSVPFSHQNERRKYVLFCKHILCVVVCKQPEAKTYSLYFCLQKEKGNLIPDDDQIECCATTLS